MQLTTNYQVVATGTKTFTAGGYSQRAKLTIYAKYSNLNEETLTANIDVKTTIKSDKSGYSWYSTNNTQKITLDGESKSKSIDVGTVTTSEKETFVTSYEVHFNEVGEWLDKAISASLDAYSNYVVTASATISLPTIAIATTPTLSVSSVELGNDIIISTPRVLTVFTHKLYYKVGDSEKTLIAENVATSYTYALPLSMADWITSATSGIVTFYCQTYRDSSLIGEKTVNLNVTIPNDIVPIISNFTVADAESEVASKIGKYLKGMSRLDVSFDASGSYSSSIISTKITVGNQSYTGTSATTNELSITGSLTITVTATDTRGRSASQSQTITVYDYNNPSISSFGVSRCNADGTADDSGTYAKVAIDAGVTNISGNTATYQVGYKLRSESDYTYITLNRTTLSLNESIVLSPIFSTDNSYDISLVVTDVFDNNNYSYAILETAFVLVDHYNDGTGMAFGKVAEEGNLIDINLPVRFRKSVVGLENTGGSGGVTSWNDLQDKPTIPTKTSQLTNDSGYLTNVPISYGNCATAAATAEKVVNVDDENWELSVGSVVMVYFTTSNSASNVKLNVNGTGAYPIWYNNAEYTSTGTQYCGYAKRVIIYMFNGTHWVWIGASYDANTTYKNVALGHGYATCTTAETTTAKVGTLASYALTLGGIVAVKFTYGVPSGSTLNINSKGAKAIYYRGVAITGGVIEAGDIATFMYDGTCYQLLSVDRWQNDIDALKIFVTPQMFGAKGDGTTDDTQAFKDAISIANGKLVIPSGEYLITSTLTVSNQVIIEGEGNDKSILKYTGSGYLFNISTNSKNRAIIRNMNFLGTTSNSLIYCGNGSWGACFKMEDCFIRTFGGVIFDLVSAFNVAVLNTRIVASGVVKARPFDTSLEFGDTITNVNYFEGVYWTGYPRESTNNMFELDNAQYFSFRSCAFESASNIFSLTNYSREIVLNECNIEQVDTVYECDNTSESPKFINITVAYDVSKFNKNSSALDYMVQTLEQNTGVFVRGATDTMGTLFGNTSIPFYKKVVVNNTSGATAQYATIYDFTTHGMNTLVPINLKRSIFTNTNSATFDLGLCTSNINVAAIYAIDALIEYKDGSYKWATVSVFGKSFSNMFVGNTMIKKISAENTNADNDDGVFTVNDRQLVYASDYTFERLSLLVRSNVTGQAY